MMRIALVALTALIVLTASGCSWFRSHSAYEKARQERPLEVPPDLDAPVADTSMAIPGASAAGASAPAQIAVAPATGEPFVIADTADSASRQGAIRSRMSARVAFPGSSSA
jgi:uncharacterized lipoprotein